MQFRFVAGKGSDFLRICLSALCTSGLCLCFSSQGVANLGVSSALLRIVRLYGSFAMPLYASPFLSVDKLLCADPFQCCAGQSHSLAVLSRPYLCLSGAVPVPAAPIRFRSFAKPSKAQQGWATPSIAPATLNWASPLRGAAVLCEAILMLCCRRSPCRRRPVPPTRSGLCRSCATGRVHADCRSPAIPGPQPRGFRRGIPRQR